jgi:predicted AAA+ superfamily ATPase
MPGKLRPFKSLYFGDAAAEDEAEKWPELFVKSFYDLRNAVDRITNGDAYLLIGPKGAGKSSYIEYLRLTSESKI